MRGLLVCAAVATATVWVAPAHADCVDYSEARHNAAAAKLQRSPPTAAQLGVPTLDGLVLDARASSEDPACASPSSTAWPRFVYTSSLTSEQVLRLLYPYLAGMRETDGMQRVWFRNPMTSNGQIKLTSGSVVEFPRSPAAANVRVVIRKAPSLTALTTASQPYSIADILEGTPWPGGAKGPRQFVRADGGN